MATKKAQAQKGAKGKKGKKAPAAQGIAVANHPKATRQIKVVKSWAGLAAFCMAAYFSWRGGAVFTDVATRALLWGISTYVAVWTMAVYVWRQVAIAEVRAAERQWKERKRADQEQVDKLRKVLEENGMPADGSGAMPVS